MVEVGGRQRARFDIERGTGSEPKAPGAVVEEDPEVLLVAVVGDREVGRAVRVEVADRHGARRRPGRERGARREGRTGVRTARSPRSRDRDEAAERGERCAEDGLHGGSLLFVCCRHPPPLLQQAGHTLVTVPQQGRRDHFRPLLRTRLTFAPRRRTAPGAGSCEATFPFGVRGSFAERILPTRQPARASFFFAPASDSRAPQ